MEAMIYDSFSFSPLFSLTSFSLELYHRLQIIMVHGVDYSIG
jgi:hypothetical protein